PIRRRPKPHEAHAVVRRLAGRLAVGEHRLPERIVTERASKDRDGVAVRDELLGKVVVARVLPQRRNRGVVREDPYVHRSQISRGRVSTKRHCHDHQRRPGRESSTRSTPSSSASSRSKRRGCRRNGTASKPARWKKWVSTE